VLELKLMGVPEVRLDDAAVNLTRRGSIALLAYLALSPRAHTRESLATLLAGDNSEEQARKLLSNVLVDLRQHLGDYVVGTRQTVAFDHGRPHSVDVLEFKSLMAEVRQRESPRELEQAIGLYRDELLAGVQPAGAPDFDSWLAAQRDELHDQYIQALRAQVDASMRRAAWTSGIQAARRLVAAEPWHEDAHRQLMQMLATSGQRHAAIAQYDVCRRLLREELGIEPQPQTTALFERLRAADTVPPNNLPPPNDRFVGRTAEVQSLIALLAGPECRLATIVGMGGSGKTRLALEVARTYACPTSTLHEKPFPDGIYFVPLEDDFDLSEPVDLPTTTATARVLAAIENSLGLPAGASATDARQRVLMHLRTRSLLLVLDNAEQQTTDAAMLSELLVEVPRLKLLVTSRVPLHLAGEHVLRLDGLKLPGDCHEVEEAEASALFLQEARRATIGFTLADDECRHLVRLCGLLAGFPLALVLAARWASVLPCSAIIEQLGCGLDVLDTRDADLPARQRSLSAVLESALRPLPVSGQQLAQALVLASHEDEPRSQLAAGLTMGDLLPQMRLLVERALVWVDATSGTFRLHPLLIRHVLGKSSSVAPRVRAA
jgi:DNA-binding SARP family transcriptional activator